MLTRVLGQALLDLKSAKVALAEAEVPLKDELGHSAGTREERATRFEAIIAKEDAEKRIWAIRHQLDAFAEGMATQPAVLERRVQFRPGFDKRDTPENHGIFGGALWFTVVGPMGAVSFELHTDWYPPSVPQHLWQAMAFRPYPKAAHVSWHTPVPAGTPDAVSCEYSETDYCLPETAYHYADRHRELLLNEGSEAMWAQLEQDYRKEFEQGGQA